MTRAHVIIADRRGLWAAAMARYVPSEMRVRQARSLAECDAELATAPASLLIVEATPVTLTVVAAWLAELSRRFPLARAVIVGDRGLGPHEWLLREAGAMHLVTSPRELGGMQTVLRRHLERLPRAKAGFAQRVWDTLPWQGAAAI